MERYIRRQGGCDAGREHEPRQFAGIDDGDIQETAYPDFYGQVCWPESIIGNETPDDGVLDGRIAGTLEGDGLDSFVGVYENYKNGKTYHIVLKKQIAENDSVQ